MNSTVTLLDQISELIAEISTKRNLYKEEYIKAWFATIPEDNLNIDYIIQNVELVEKFDSTKHQLTWYLRIKDAQL